MSLQNMPLGDFFGFLLGKKPEEKQKGAPDSQDEKTEKEKSDLPGEKPTTTLKR
ncbi:MAG: hypothetical protein WCT49_04340 [Candidatus Paceibacterota bacterium]|jgi:hypothetical protein|nr:hypothetical protein [Candidatus Paceibacterota bacterium]